MMKTIDLSPLYRNTIGFDRLAAILDGAYQTDQNGSSYPPYDIEALEENRYSLTLAVAGFENDELDVQVERGVLTVKGGKKVDKSDRNYLYRGIAARAFERKFNLAEHMEISGASLNNGLLSIELKQEIPEEMKPKRIEIQTSNNALEHQPESSKAA